MQLSVFKAFTKNSNLEWQRHALQRIIERGILRIEVKNAILNGDIIEEYNNDYPFPSVLIAYINSVKSLHVVLSYDETNDKYYIITVYIPSEIYFEKDLITRKIL